MIVAALRPFVNEREFITEIQSVATNLKGTNSRNHLDVAGERLSNGEPHTCRYHWGKSEPEVSPTPTVWVRISLMFVPPAD